MKVLIVDDETEIRELIVFSIQDEFPNAEIIEADSGKSAIDALNDINDINIVLSDYDMPGGNGGLIQQHILSNQLETEFVLISSRDPKKLDNISTDDLNVWLRKPFDHDQLIHYVHNIRSSQQLPKATDTFRYFKVKKSILKQFKSIPFAIYLKVSEDHYIKLLHENVDLQKGSGAKALDKDVKEFYIEKEHSTDFIEHYKQVIVADYLWSTRPIENKFETVATVQESLSDLAQGLNFSKEVFELVDECVDRVIQDEYYPDPIKKFLEKYTAGNKHYLYEHAVATAVIASGLAERFEMDPKRTARIFTQAALIHDMALTEELMDFKLLYPDEVKMFKTSKEVKVKEIVAHPGISAAHLNDSYSALPEVYDIIIQHHEKPDGSGFPMGLEKYAITEHAAIFILAQELAMFILNHPHPKSFNPVIMRINKNYKGGHFDKVKAYLIESLSDKYV